MEKQSIIRRGNYDALRILSTVAVVFIHVNWLYFEPVYADSNLSLTWITFSLVNILTRFSVPAFIMISGAFVLSDERNGDFKYFYNKVLKKVILPTAAIIFLFSIIQVIKNFAKEERLFHGLKGIITGGFYNLWFIYMLVGLYFLVPYLVRLKKTISWKQYKILAVVLIVWAVISQATSEQKLAYSIGVVFAFLGYYLLGDIIKRELDSGWKPSRTILILICLICVAIAFVWRLMGNNYYISLAYLNFFSPMIVLYSLCIFVLFGMLNVATDLSFWAELTFEIYLFHTFVLRIIAPITQGVCRNPILGELLIAVITLLLSTPLALGYKLLYNKICNNRRGLPHEKA